MRLIKRLVAVPGDVIELRDERLIVNGVAAEYGGFHWIDEQGASGTRQPALLGTERSAASAHEIQLLPQVPALRSFGPVVVPADSYFFLGDNRDDSADSRYIGVVPRQRLIGRARAVLVSADVLDGWAPRFERFARPIR
jgi:signal peptidase I